VKFWTAAGAAALSIHGSARAEDVVLRVGDPLTRADLLKPGTQRYLRYLIKGGHRNPVDLWVRTISFETKDGRRLVRVAQQWDGVGPEPTVRLEDSLAEAVTMRPISHERSLTVAGKTKTSAYLFDGEAVRADPARADNAAAGFSKAAPAPLYNFVPDVEWFRQLPMRAGRTFVADLYDPGSGEPDRFRFKVDGSDRIAGPDGHLVDCWLVTTDYNHPEHGLTRYWFAKTNQYMIRQEVDGGERGYLVKILLPPEAGDLTEEP